MGFNALYSYVTREVREKLGRVAKDVLIELANYSNPMGICWPGFERLADDTGYAVEVVQDAIRALEEADYLRRHFRYSSVRGQWEFEAYQLSPDVVCLGNEYVETAIKSYGRFIDSHAICNSSPGFVSKESQHLNNNKTEHLQEHQRTPKGTPTTTTTKTETALEGSESKMAESDARPVSAPAENKEQGQKTKDKDQNLESRSRPTAPTGATKKKPSPSSAAPPPVSYAEYQDELNPDLENVAQQLWVESGNLPMPIARQLVATHGPKICLAALRNYGQARDVINPGGYIRAIIERRAVAPAYDDLPAAPADNDIDERLH